MNTTKAIKSSCGKTLLFNTCADPSRAARLHLSTCSMVSTAKVVAEISADELQADIADLNERGFPVKACKCLK